MISFGVRQLAAALARPKFASGAILLMLLFAAPAFSYSVLSHETIIDSVWDSSIVPMLHKRYGNLTEEQIRKAHACAYGGSLIQDMGYYPFGSRLFTDLTHYVRSGDFVVALLDEAKDAEEYAFATGALAHYAADNIGHPQATNRAVPLLYPKLRRKFGDLITYWQGASAHIKTEFGFDVVQVARGAYPPEAYRDFIGFCVSKPVLERAFRRTYGLDPADLFTSFDMAIGSYRRTASSIIPQATEIAWELKRDEIEKASPGITREKFQYRITRAEYEKAWGTEYKKPGVFARLLSWFFRVVPKVGPFRGLAFKPPTPEAEKMFLASFDTTLRRYRDLLAQAGRGELTFANRNFDTGEPVHAGDYPLADRAYAELLERHEKKDFRQMPPALRSDILSYFADLSRPFATKKDKRDWQRTVRALDRLKTAGTP